MEGILGLRRVTGGAITLRGAEINDEPTRRMRARGVGCIPSDRLKMGLVAELSVLENTLLGFDGLPKLRVGPLFRQSMLRDRAAGVVREFDVRTGSLDGAVSHLSGGNQQKLILGRELRENPGLIIAVQPTRGVDIGAIEFIEETLLQRRREGAAILLVSNELEEILALADSILVLFRGAVAGAGQADRFTRDEIGLLMAGVAEASR